MMDLAAMGFDPKQLAGMFLDKNLKLPKQIRVIEITTPEGKHATGLVQGNTIAIAVDGDEGTLQEALHGLLPLVSGIGVTVSATE